MYLISWIQRRNPFNLPDLHMQITSTRTHSIHFQHLKRRCCGCIHAEMVYKSKTLLDLSGSHTQAGPYEGQQSHTAPNRLPSKAWSVKGLDDKMTIIVAI